MIKESVIPIPINLSLFQKGKMSTMVQDLALINDWIVACPASQVTDKPIQVMIMNERVVIFRNSTGIHAFKDLCIHRGAPLSLGNVVNDNIVCPYHGWEYNDKGDCVKIPQLPCNRSIPLKAKAIPYACKEMYGFVWINIGNNSPAFFSYKEFGDPQFRNVIWGPQTVKAKAPRIIENFLDVGHLAILHEGYLGDPNHTEIDDYEIYWEDDRVHSSDISVFQPDPDGTGIAKNVFYTYEIFRPLTVKFSKRDPENGNIFSMFLAVLPVDAETSIAYGVMSFNYETNQSDEELNAFQDLIFSQDAPIVENQKPEDLPLDLQAELHLKCDKVSIAYRQYLTKQGVTFGTA